MNIIFFEKFEHLLIHFEGSTNKNFIDIFPLIYEMAFNLFVKRFRLIFEQFKVLFYQFGISFDFKNHFKINIRGARS